MSLVSYDGGVSELRDFTYTLLSNCWAVGTEYQLLGSTCEQGKTSNWEVLVVELWVAAEDIIGLYMLDQYTSE